METFPSPLASNLLRRECSSCLDTKILKLFNPLENSLISTNPSLFLSRDFNRCTAYSWRFGNSFAPLLILSMTTSAEASGKIYELSSIYFSVYSSALASMNLNPTRNTVAPMTKSFSE